MSFINFGMLKFQSLCSQPVHARCLQFVSFMMLRMPEPTVVCRFKLNEVTSKWNSEEHGGYQRDNTSVTSTLIEIGHNEDSCENLLKLILHITQQTPLTHKKVLSVSHAYPNLIVYGANWKRLEAYVTVPGSTVVVEFLHTHKASVVAQLVVKKL